MSVVRDQDGSHDACGQHDRHGTATGEGLQVRASSRWASRLGFVGLGHRKGASPGTAVVRHGARYSNRTVAAIASNNCTNSSAIATWGVTKVSSSDFGLAGIGTM